MTYTYTGIIDKSSIFYSITPMDTIENPRLYFSIPPEYPTGFHNEDWFAPIDFSKNSTIYLHLRDLYQRSKAYTIDLQLDTVQKVFHLTQTRATTCECYKYISGGNPVEVASRYDIFILIPKADSTYMIDYKIVYE